MKQGMSLVAISVSILIIITLASVVTVGLVSNYNQTQKVEIANELDMIQIAVDNYKLNNGNYPIADESIAISNVSNDIKNTQFANETEKSEGYLFNVIDFSKLEINNLKNGTGKEYDDKYVISTETGKVYYAKGKQIGNNKYYTLTDELAGIVSLQKKLEKNSDNPIKYEDTLGSNKLNIKAYVPKDYIVQSVTYENDTVNLKSTEELYYVYETNVTKVGTLTVNYSYNGEIKVSKYIVDKSKLNFKQATTKLYTLSFDANGGVCDITSINKPQGYSIVMPEATKENELFLGWYTELDGGEKVEYEKMPNYNQTLYARYNRKHTFTLVTGSGTSTSGSTRTGEYFVGETITLRCTANNGYSSPRWTSSNTALVPSPTSTSATFIMPDGDIKMTSSASINSYTITYDLVGGSVSPANPTSYTINSSFTLKNPTRARYDFVGWTGSNGSTPQMTVTISNTTGNKNFTANWVSNMPPLSFSKLSGPGSFSFSGSSGTFSSHSSGDGNYSSTTYKSTIELPYGTTVSFSGKGTAYMSNAEGGYVVGGIEFRMDSKNGQYCDGSLASNDSSRERYISGSFTIPHEGYLYITGISCDVNISIN